MWGMTDANHGLMAQQLPLPPSDPPGPPPGPSPEPPVVEPPPDGDMPLPGEAPPAPIGDPPAEKPIRMVMPKEIGGPKGPEPTRYGDWEQKGRATDF